MQDLEEIQKRTAEKYKDILQTERPQNEKILQKYPRMSLENRAKIFSPFAALRGYDQKIADEGQKTYRVVRQDLLDEEKEILSNKLSACKKGMKVSVVYFEKDSEEFTDLPVGIFCELTGTIARIDPIGQTIQVNQNVISFSEIQDIVEILE